MRYAGGVDALVRALKAKGEPNASSRTSAGPPNPMKSGERGEPARTLLTPGRGPANLGRSPAVSGLTIQETDRSRRWGTAAMSIYVPVGPKVSGRRSTFRFANFGPPLPRLLLMPGIIAALNVLIRL